MQTRLAAALALLLSIGLPTAAHADILKAVTFALDASGSSRALMPLTSAAATSISFSVPGNQSKKIAFTYSASCGAAGPVNGFIDIDIVVDGLEISPTNTSGESFCSVDQTEALDTLARATIIGVKSLTPGQHTVEVYAEALGGATQFQLGYTTLLIQD